MQKVDYSALKRKITDVQTNEALAKMPYFLKVSDKKYLVYLFTLTIVYMLLQLSGALGTNILGIVYWYFIIYFLSILNWFARQKVREFTEQGLKAYNFAKENDFYLIMFDNPKFDYNVNLEKFNSKESAEDNGLLFNLGERRTKSNRLGKEGVFTIFDYKYSTGSKDNKRAHNWSVSRLKLTRKLPNLVFDSTSNNQWFLSNLPVTFKNSQKISLEGDFDKYFTLYAPKKYKIDTLSFITPEVMAHMIDELRDAEIEIIDNYLYIYREGNTDDYGYKLLITELFELAEEIEDNIDSYRDDRLTRMEGKALDRHNIAKAGLRLKKKRISQSSVIVLIAIFAIINPIILLPLLILYYGLTKGLE